MKFVSAVSAIMAFVTAGSLSVEAREARAGEKSGNSQQPDEEQTAIHNSKRRSLNTDFGCDLEGEWTLNFVCHDGNVPNSYTIGPFLNNWVITNRGDGFYNLFGQRAIPDDYVLDFNYTVQEMPGNPNRLVGAVSWVNYYPDPTAPNATGGQTPGPFDYPPEIVPPLIQVSIDFDKRCNWWFNFMAQRPREVPPFIVYQPPMHFCYADATRTEPDERRELRELPSQLRKLAPGPNANASPNGCGAPDTIPTCPVKNQGFLGDYDAEVKCYVGNREVLTFQETHHITNLTSPANTPFPNNPLTGQPYVGASEEPGRFFLFQRDRTNLDFKTIDIVQPNGLDRTIFYGSNMNVSEYNLVDGDPAYNDPNGNQIPLITFELYFDDLKYDAYSMVLFGQRPGFRGGAIEDDEDGVHVCSVRAVKKGLTVEKPQTCSLCNPSGKYDSSVDCRRYTNDIGVFDENTTFTDLGKGFYQMSSSRPDGFEMESVLVEHPTTPGLYVGSAYERGDVTDPARVNKDFNVYINMQVQFFSDDVTFGACDSFGANLQGWRPGIVEDSTRNDTVHYCKYNSTRVDGEISP